MIVLAERNPNLDEDQNREHQKCEGVQRSE